MLDALNAQAERTEDSIKQVDIGILDILNKIGGNIESLYNTFLEALKKHLNFIFRENDIFATLREAEQLGIYLIDGAPSMTEYISGLIERIDGCEIRDLNQLINDIEEE